MEENAMECDVDIICDDKMEKGIYIIYIEDLKGKVEKRGVLRCGVVAAMLHCGWLRFVMNKI